MPYVPCDEAWCDDPHCQSDHWVPDPPKLNSYDAALEAGSTVLEAAFAEINNLNQVLTCTIPETSGEVREDLQMIADRLKELAARLKAAE
tara:strand:- start:1137 stop:1406 length:270 start_codon:yes stop_codon:yes gene_type:complete